MLTIKRFKIYFMPNLTQTTDFQTTDPKGLKKLVKGLKKFGISSLEISSLSKQ